MGKDKDRARTGVKVRKGYMVRVRDREGVKTRVESGQGIGRGKTYYLQITGEGKGLGRGKGLERGRVILGRVWAKTRFFSIFVDVYPQGS